LVLFSSTASAIVVDPPSRIHSVPLPANGVALFYAGSLGSSFEVQVTDEDEQVVPGSLSAVGGYWGWRATTPLPLGSYTWTTLEDAYITNNSGILSVIESYQPEEHELGLALALGSVDVFDGEVVCCEPDPESRTLGNGCFQTEITQAPQLQWVVSSPLPMAHSAQYLYRYTEAPETKPEWALDSNYFPHLSSGVLTVLPADEYCLTIEALSLIDEQTFVTTACVPHTLPEPQPIARPSYAGAFTLYSCPLPPAGYEDEWCDVVGAGCTEPGLQLDQDAWLAVCEPVFERCGLTPPEMPVEEPPIPVVDAGFSDPDPGPPISEDPSVSERLPEDDDRLFACSCSTPGGRAAEAHWFAALLAALYFGASRRQRKAHGPTRSPSR
jgi:MYXO-CTERM domain-containing protein